MHQPTVAVVELAEQHSQAAAVFSLTSLEDARKRAHSLLLVLISGGGAIGAVGVARLESNLLLGVAALVSAGVWYAAAAYLACSALTTSEVRAWATPGLLDQYSEWSAWVETETAEMRALGRSQGWPDALLELRKSAVRNCELAAAEYRSISTRAHRVIDRAFRLAALAPAVAAVAVAAAYLAG